MSAGRFEILRPGDWAGLPHQGWWAVSDRMQIIGLFRTQSDAVTYARLKARHERANTTDMRVLGPLLPRRANGQLAPRG